DGEVAVAIPRKELCARFNVTSNHFGSLVQAFRGLAEEARDLARDHEAPLRLLIKLSRIRGADVAKRQVQALKDWIAQQEELKAAGRKRARRGEGSRRTGVLKATRRIDEWGTVDDYLRALRAK